jgi:alpha-tubulin suppressor-like RCC1 family protein
MFTTPGRRVAILLLAGILVLLASTTTQVAASVTDIYITDQGLQPPATFAAVGAPVVWHNDTAAPIRLSNHPFQPEPAEDSPRLYLPSLAAPARSLAAASIAAPAVVHWTSDPIAPGQVYTRTYASPGDYAFFVSAHPDITGTAIVLANTAVGNELIEAEQGGSVQVDNVTLAVPPGALAQDMIITVAHPDAVTLGADGTEYVQLEPSGLTFDQPVTLTVTYTDSPNLDERFINFAIYSETTGEWESLPILARDAAGNRLTVQFSHFSYGAFYTDEPLYMVMNLPGKYLRSGDILYRMDPECGQNRADWFPGHVGMYSETVGTTPSSQVIVESNPNGWTSHLCTSEGGVAQGTLDKFIENSCEFYLGARRPIGVSAPIERQARDLAVGQIGKGYLAIGQGDWLSNGDCYSCVGLIEDAYERTGVDIVPWNLSPGITPLDQYKRTIPVNEITVEVGEEIHFAVYSIIKVATSASPDYYARGGSVTVADLPAGGSFTDGYLTWTPPSAFGGKTFVVRFDATARVGNEDYDRFEVLAIHVADAASPPTPTSTSTSIPTPTATNTPTPTSTATSTPTPTIPPASGIQAIAPGDQHTCALTAAGGVKCWGGNSNGQMGNGTYGSESKQLIPADVPGLTSGVVAITAGSYHTCAINSSGGVKCWGDNTNGQLGDGTQFNIRASPVDVLGLSSGVQAIDAGEFHTCVLTTADGVKCWGSNLNGKLGDGTETWRQSPVDVVGLSLGVIAIDIGRQHSCALMATGGIKCWGSNYWGQLGDSTTDHHFSPVDVVGLTSGVSAITAGGFHTCAITAAGGAKCWGFSYAGELGDGTTGDAEYRRLTPVDVVSLTSGVAALTAGNHHTCALTAAGSAKCWGLADDGQVGDGTNGDADGHRLTPVDVVGLTSGVAAIAAGYDHACAITTGGDVKCWGYNPTGQLGDGTYFNSRTSPVDVVWP